MKICVIGLDQAVPEVVFQDERLSNLHRLMDAGLYGLIEFVTPDPGNPWSRFLTSESPVSSSARTIWDYLAESGKQTIVHGPVSSDADAFATSAQRWDAAKRQLAEEPWDGFQFVDNGLNQISQSHEDDKLKADYYAMLDEQIGSLMEMMDDQTILLVLAPPCVSAGFFLMAAPNCPINGEHQGVSLLDLAPTLLDLAGYAVPLSMQGRSLVVGMEKLVPSEVDHEKIIYDRLAGLGYV